VAIDAILVLIKIILNKFIFAVLKLIIAVPVRGGGSRMGILFITKKKVEVDKDDEERDGEGSTF
jgi:GTP-sensing pleiotropic transcriptional regulator CodY